MAAAMFREMAFYEPLQCPQLNSTWASQRPLEKCTEPRSLSNIMLLQGGHQNGCRNTDRKKFETSEEMDGASEFK